MRGAFRRRMSRGLVIALACAIASGSTGALAGRADSDEPFSYRVTDQLVVQLAREEAANSSCILRTEFISPLANSERIAAFERCLSEKSSSSEQLTRRDVFIARAFLAEFGGSADEMVKISNSRLASMCGRAPSLLLSQITRRRASSASYQPPPATLMVGSLRVQTPSNDTCFASAAAALFFEAKCVPEHRRFRSNSGAKISAFPPAHAAVCRALNQ